MVQCPVCKSQHNDAFGEKSGYALRRCSGCGLLFVEPMPSVGELNDFYNAYHKTSQYTAKLASKIRRAVKRIRSVRRYLRGKRFVDVGCNAGFAVKAAHELGLDAYGIDIDPDSVSFARQTFPECRFDVASAQQCAAGDERYDLIYCSEVIEHLPEVDEFVAALYQMLAPDGMIFLTTPDVGHYTLRKGDLMQWDGIRPPEHLLYFNKKNLDHLFNRHGFRKIKYQWSFKPTIKAVIRK